MLNLIDFGFLLALFQATVAGIPLVFLVMALTFVIRQAFNLEGNHIRLVALGLGVVFGVLYQLGEVVPANYSQWLSMIVFALTFGVVAFLGYDLIKALVMRGFEKYIGQVEEGLVMGETGDPLDKL